MTDDRDSIAVAMQAVETAQRHQAAAAAYYAMAVADAQQDLVVLQARLDGQGIRVTDELPTLTREQWTDIATWLHWTTGAMQPWLKRVPGVEVLQRQLSEAGIDARDN